MSQKQNEEGAVMDAGFASTVEELPASVRHEASQLWHNRQRVEGAADSPRARARAPLGTWFLLTLLVVVGASLTGLALLGW
ncbi:MAG: hypothetical protein KGO50_16060 [Myxococcales bacterium]|nr:hypothetical protein [Myxococcales bacterium]